MKSNSGDEDQAKDAFHDGMIKIMTMARNNKLQLDTEVNAYLFTTCRNFWIEKARRDKKIKLSDQSLDRGQSEESSFSQLLLSEKAVAMTAMLESIGNRCRDLLKLTFYMDHSLEEAAEILGISNAGVAKTTQYRCKKKLMEAISGSASFKELMDLS